MAAKSGVGKKLASVIMKHRAEAEGTGFAESCAECAGFGRIVNIEGGVRLKCSRSEGGQPQLVTELQAKHCDTTKPPQLVDLQARGIYVDGDEYSCGVCPTA